MDPKSSTVECPKENAQSNKDLLLCENPFFLEKSKLSNKLNFNKDKDDKKGKTLKTERITSSVLSQVKGFLDMVKTNNPKCVNIEKNVDDDNDQGTEADNEKMKHENCDNENIPEIKQDIELNLLLFPRNDDDESNDSDSEDGSSEAENEGRNGKMAEILQ